MSLSKPNLVILLSGPGTSALAIVRIAGEGVPTFLADHFSRPTVPGRLVHGTLRDEKGVIDDPVVALALDGKSADITLHGGAWVIQAAIECAIGAGFVLVEQSAAPLWIMSEAKDALDAEVQLALPLARTELSARTLLAQPDAWRAFISAPRSPAEIQAVLDDRSLHHLLHPPTVAIIGLPNAGKSTLANQLFGQQRSIVSPVAGTTRDWVGEEANLDGLIVKLLDTPGRHETDDPIERQAIAQSDPAIKTADLAILLFDASRDYASQKHLLDLVKGDRVLIANKMDLATQEWSPEFLFDGPFFPISAKSHDSISAVSQVIRLHLHPRRRPIDAPRCWTSRQVELLTRSLSDPTLLKALACDNWQSS